MTRAQNERDRLRANLFDALGILEQLDARHVPDETGKACDGCGMTYPCSDRRILDRGRA